MKILKVVFLSIAFLALAVNAGAQEKGRDGDRQRQSREQMVETQAKYIAGELALDDKVYDRFVTTYTNYKKEMWTTAPKLQRRGKDRPAKSETEEQAAANMQKRFDQSQKMLDIRMKYYKEFSKFLSQKQIERMYDKERKMMKRLEERHDKHHKDRR